MEFRPGPWPKISLVTPSYNQAEFLEDTLRSVLDQGYPNLEYIVMDGASADASVETIQRYASQLTYWTSEPDAGQTDAINKGFDRSTGEILGWLNSDDMLCPWTLEVVGDIFRELPEVEWLTSSKHLLTTEGGMVRYTGSTDGYTRGRFYSGRHMSDFGNVGMVQQEATFWRRSLWEKVGGRLDTRYRNSFDWDLWARMWEHARLVSVDVPLSRFRIHARQKTSAAWETSHKEAYEILSRYGNPRGRTGVQTLGLRLSRFWAKLAPLFGEEALYVWFATEDDKWRLGRRHVV